MADEATATTWIFVDGDAWAFRELVASRRSRAAGATDGDVRSPMPGTVVHVHVSRGEPVRAGQPLVVIEAMKMEHVLVAAHDGTVDVLVGEGDLVAADEVVARIERSRRRVSSSRRRASSSRRRASSSRRRDDPIHAEEAYYGA